MGLDIISLLIAVAMSIAPGLQRPDLQALPHWAVFEPAFRPQSREVTNWRLEAARNLDSPAAFALSLLFGETPAALPRCVKLNNYWCIKRAGWAGEIAADAEGHVAFASAAEGAQTAALLLRRYYVDFGWKSAQAIVSHWAPAQCGISIGGARVGSLAVRGLGGTLRARWLAAHRGGAKGTAGVRRSVVAERPLPLMRTPSIEAGVSEVPLTSSINLAALTLTTPLTGQRERAAPVASCASESQRIARYAGLAVAGIAGSPGDDLKLFDSAGQSTANLARIMANMAAVEIGPLRADPDLIAAAVARGDAAHAVASAQKSPPPR